MTATSPAAPAARAVRSGRPAPPGWGGLLASEWTKIRSVRSTVWTLVMFVVVTLGLTALFTWLTVANWNGPQGGAAGRAGDRRPGRLHPGRRAWGWASSRCACSACW